jgi:hypothetical protein
MTFTAQKAKVKEKVKTKKRTSPSPSPLPAASAFTSTCRFVLADGTTIERQISEAHITLPMGDATTPIVLGQNGDQPLLADVTLGALGLESWSFDLKLHPARLVLA